jgi:hypothetical protein
MDEQILPLAAQSLIRSGFAGVAGPADLMAVLILRLSRAQIAPLESVAQSH